MFCAIACAPECPAVVARREADAYGGRSMLDLIAGDEHEWLLQSVNESFDFARVA